MLWDSRALPLPSTARENFSVGLQSDDCVDVLEGPAWIHDLHFDYRRLGHTCGLWID